MGSELEGAKLGAAPVPYQGWTPQASVNVLGNDAPNFAETESRYLRDALSSRELFQGPLAKAIEHGDLPIVQLFDTYHPHTANETVVRDTSHSDKTGLKRDGKLVLQYDIDGKPASAEFRDALGNVEDIVIDGKTHTFLVADKFQSVMGSTATLEFDEAGKLKHENILLPKSSQQYDLDGDKLTHHLFTLDDTALELRDENNERTITGRGPAMGRNPIIKEKFEYGPFQSTPRSVEFTVANGKQYRGTQLRDGRWQVQELK